MSLPLKVQLGIRDHWTADGGSLQVSLKKLGDVLGQKVTVDPEWHLLINELGEFYPDKANLVQIIAGCVEVFTNSATELLEDEATNELWIEALLEKTKNRSQLKLLVETTGQGNALASWSDQRLGFEIHLPKKKIIMPSELYPTFRSALLGCFDEKDASGRSQPAAADDWADVKLDAATGKLAVSEKASPAFDASAVEFFPNWESLPRPDELLLRAPYHLILHASSSRIEIEGSHSPSLKFLSDYLKRWCRVNHNDTRAVSHLGVLLSHV
ncbi:hypothetical protein ACHAQA_008115 [Verticillium albo-atrum]